MGMATNNPMIKGPACQALDDISLNQPAIMKLQSELVAISGSNKFNGLENILADFLLPYRSNPAPYTSSQIAAIRQTLKKNWFDPTSSECYFPGLKVAEVYGIGLLKTLELALQFNVPIDAWWSLNNTTIDMSNVVSARQVTLFIGTPRPVVPKSEKAISASIERSVGFSTRDVDGAVSTTKLPIPGR